MKPAFVLRAAGILLALAILILPGCDNPPSDLGSPYVPQTITGIVSAPATDSQQFVASRSLDPLGWVASAFMPAAVADITGLQPVPYAQVELVRLDNLGNVITTLQIVGSDASGVYTFNGTPPPDSTLAVRVVGQTDVMRAIVTGPTVDISPISEVVTSDVLGSLGGSVVLGNFTVSEVAALNGLVTGMDVDVGGATFAQAVTAIDAASAPVVNGFVQGFSSAGAVATLTGKSFGALDYSPLLADPFVLGVGNGGFALRSGTGGFGFGYGDWISDGQITGLQVLHDLTSVQQPTSATVQLRGLSHVLTANGKVVVDAGGGKSVAGAVTANASFMVYPLDTTAVGTLGTGLRLVTRSSGGALLDNTLLDPSGGGATNYNMVALRTDLSGHLSNTGENSAVFTTETGTLTFDSDLQILTGGSTYGTLGSGTLATDRLAADLDGSSVSASGSLPKMFAGSYLVFPDGGLLFRNPDNTFLGQGSATANGEYLTLSTSADRSQVELDVLANDSDPDVGNLLKLVQVGATSAGGTVTINAADNKLLYIPPSNSTGGISDSFTYTVSDGTTTSTGNVTLNLATANSAPVAVNDSGLNVPMGSSNNILDVLANDSDPDLRDTLTITAVGTPSAGGTVSINGATLLYTPLAGYNGNDVFTYTISDGVATAIASVTVTVLAAANSAPVAVDDGGMSVPANSVNTLLDVLANDSDPDVGDTLTITQAAVVLAPSAGGTVTVNGTSDRLVYTPAPGYSGTESFSYTITDGTDTASATVTMTVVAAGNTVPTAVDDAGLNVAMGSSGNLLIVLANDFDADIGDTLTITQAGVVQAPTAGGTVSVNGTNDRLVYTPVPGYSGTDSFSYTISDGKATASPATRRRWRAPMRTVSVATAAVISSVCWRTIPTRISGRCSASARWVCRATVARRSSTAATSTMRRRRVTSGRRPSPTRSRTARRPRRRA